MFEKISGDFRPAALVPAFRCASTVGAVVAGRPARAFS
jgi:hypothetical protein